MAGGGGSVSSIPSSIQETHEYLLRKANTSDPPKGGVGKDVDQAKQWNPYLYHIAGYASDGTYTTESSVKTAYDPDAYLAIVNDTWDDTQNVLEAISHQADWGGMVEQALGKATGNSTSVFLEDPSLRTSILNTIETTALAVAKHALNDADEGSVFIATESTDDVIDAAVSKATTVLASTPISNAVDAYESRRNPAFLRGLNRFAGAMADIGSVNSSAFVLGMVLAEKDRADDINQFDANIALQTHGRVVETYVAQAGRFSDAQLQMFAQSYREVLTSFFAEVAEIRRGRVAFVNAAAGQMSQVFTSGLDLRFRNTVLKTDISRNAIIAKKEENDKSIDIDVHNAIWRLETYQYAANFIASYQGGVMSPKGPSILQSALSGASAGAGMGTAAFPGVGTAVGAGLGAIVGAFS